MNPVEYLWRRSFLVNSETCWLQGVTTIKRMDGYTENGDRALWISYYQNQEFGSISIFVKTLRLKP